MGGFGSGRYGAWPTSDATQSFVLEMAVLVRAGIGPGPHGKAQIHFGEEQFPVELTIDMRWELTGRLPRSPSVSRP